MARDGTPPRHPLGITPPRMSRQPDGRWRLAQQPLQHDDLRPPHPSADPLRRSRRRHPGRGLPGGPCPGLRHHRTRPHLGRVRRARPCPAGVRRAARTGRLPRSGRAAAQTRRVPGAQRAARGAAGDAAADPRRSGGSRGALAGGEGRGAGQGDGRRVRPRQLRSAGDGRQHEGELWTRPGRPASGDPAAVAGAGRRHHGERRPVPADRRGMRPSGRCRAAQPVHRERGARHRAPAPGPGRGEAVGLGQLVRDVCRGGVCAEVPAAHRPLGAGQQW